MEGVTPRDPINSRNGSSKISVPIPVRDHLSYIVFYYRRSGKTVLCVNAHKEYCVCVCVRERDLF